jgi:hypothetical protein
LGASLTTLGPRTNLTGAAYVFNAPRMGGLPAAAYQRTWTNVVVVGRGGPADGVDTNTLAGGLALAGGKATALNPYTVLLLPGVYAGGVQSTNYVDIIGVARASCTITGALTILHSILVENVAFDVDASHSQAIKVDGGRPTLCNLLITAGSDGVVINPSANGAQLLNIETVAGGWAVRDQRGALIDGLRAVGNGVMAVSMTSGGINVDYKNIAQQGGQYVLQAAMGMGAVNGDVRHVTAEGGIALQRAGVLLLRDLVVEVNVGGNAALQINGIDTRVTVADARLRGPVGVQYGQSGMALPPITGQSVFDDVEIVSLGSLSAALMAHVPAATITVQHCELVSESGRGIDIATNALLQTTAALYIQTLLIAAAQEGINLDGATQLWLYDSTVKCGLAAVQGNAAPGPAQTPAPRIADCRLETDTNPSQGVGGPGWNAFGGSGNAGGTGEDTRGNLVAPTPGTPVAP